MKLLVYGINYYPEAIGIGKFSGEMCEWFAAQGHEVHVITAMPYYPAWSVLDGYKNRGWFSEQAKGVTIQRCPIYVPKHASGLNRIFHELSFAISSIRYWVPAIFRKYDVILSVAPPLQIGLPAIFYNIFHRALLIYHVQDLQLDAAMKLKLINNRIVLRLISMLEKFLLRKSSFVSTISEGMKRKIIEKGVSINKVIDFRNWTDTNYLFPEPSDADTRKYFNIPEGQKVVLYSGNLGEKQGLEILADAAEQLKHSNVVFLIIGEGAYKKRLEADINSRGIVNVMLFPLQPYDKMGRILNIADLHLVLQKKAAADLVMPSKLTAILSVGGCAIVTADEGTALYDLVTLNDMAIVVEPENPKALAEAIVRNVNADLSRYRDNARLYAVNCLDKQAVLEKFERFLSTEIKKPSLR